MELSPGPLRQLACDATIIPAVLDGDSETLDIGRARRTWPTAIRRAATLRDGGCAWPHGCDTAIRRCELHHLQHWAEGGPTSLANAAHLCHFHHWLINERDWTPTRSSNGQLIARRT